MTPEEIKRLLIETGQTQRQLAIALDLDPSAVTRLLKGQRRLRLDEAPRVRAFFGLPVAESDIAIAKPNVRARAVGRQPDMDSAAMDLPVYASAQGGPEGMVIDREPIEWTRRPPMLAGVVDAFAFYVVGDSMWPRFQQGERLLVHPRRPPRPGQDVLLILNNEDGHEFNALVKTLKSLDGDTAVLEQYNPRKELTFSRSQIDALYLIVGNDFSV